MSFDLSSKKISKTFQHILQQRGDDNKLYDLQGNEIGDLKISGSLIADRYVVSSSVSNIEIVTTSGSSTFGNSDDDTHQFTGSLHVSGSIIPNGSGSYDLGSSTNPWKDIHVMSSSIHIYDTNGVISTISAKRGTGLEVTDKSGTSKALKLDTLQAKNINVDDSVTTTLGHISASGNISASGTGSYGHLMLSGGNFTSASLASAIAGGDNLGSHIATQALNIDNNTITNTSHITPDEDITKDLGSASLRFRTLYASETQIGGVFETGLRTKDIDNFETGTVVVWSKDGLTPCVNAYDNLVMGVIKKGRDVPIVLGAEPVLLTGKVKLGEYIVTSKKLGHGMAISEKLFFNKNLFGKVIGQALEDAEGESVLVKCMVRKI